MANLTQRFRVRLRRVSRVATQLSELFDFLGFVFIAQVFRAVFLVALLALLLLELLVRNALLLSVLSMRFLRVRLIQVVRAFFGVATCVALLSLILSDTNEWEVGSVFAQSRSI